MTTNYFNLAGLVFDIAGASVLGWGILSNSIERIAWQAATQWSFNRGLARALSEQHIDARIGVPLLVAGFALQLVSVCQSGSGWVLAVAFGVLAVCLGWYFLNRKRWIETRAETAKEFHDADQKRRTEEAAKSRGKG